MTESNARQLLFLTTGMSIFTAIVAIFLGLRGSQWLAAVFLFFAVAGMFMSGILYRRYTVLRDRRWGRELEESEKEMHTTLSEASTEGVTTGSSGEPSNTSSVHRQPANNRLPTTDN